MTFPAVILLSTCVMAALISTAAAAARSNVRNGPTSPCPGLFEYDSVNQPDYWTGTVRLISDDELHGIWLRLFFDRTFKEVNVEDNNFEVVSTGDTNEVLIKNRNALLKSNAGEKIKITVKYEGREFPNLMGYRLNAKSVCPLPNTQRTDFFTGDANSQDFLASILSNSPKPTTKPEFECGLSPSTHVYPWVVPVLITQGGQHKYVCEGTLISPSHVLTPAHCVTFKHETLVVPEAAIEAMKTSVAKVTVHPGYDPKNLFNDIAVLQLKSPLPVTDEIRPICLDDEEDIETESTLVGYAIKSDGKIGNTLVTTNVKNIGINDCAKEAPELEGVLGDGAYCVTYLSGNANCAGDSGSTLVSYRNNVASLRGIVNLGISLQNKKACNDGSIVVATDVSRYLRWIRHVL